MTSFTACEWSKAGGVLFAATRGMVASWRSLSMPLERVFENVFFHEGIVR